MNSYMVEYAYADSFDDVDEWLADWDVIAESSEDAAREASTYGVSRDALFKVTSLQCDKYGDYVPCGKPHYFSFKED